MKRKLFLSMAALSLVVLGLSCGDEGNDLNPCDGVVCSGHGTCVEAGANATCDCDDDYHADGLECIADADPCDGQTCSGHGTCVLVGEDATCECDTGYHAQGLECVANADPCNGVDCSAHGICVVEGTDARCECDDGYHADGLECLEDLQPGTATVVASDLQAAAGGQDRVNIREMTHGDDLADYDFIVAKNPTMGPMIMLGPDVSALDLGNGTDYHAVDEAPVDGYQFDDGGTLVIGTSWRDGGTGQTGFDMTENVYVLKLADGSFGKIEVLVAIGGKIDVLCYHQADDSRNIATVSE